MFRDGGKKSTSYGKSVHVTQIIPQPLAEADFPKELLKLQSLPMS